MTKPSALHFDFATKPWAALLEQARDKFTAWMTNDPTGQALATETDGDLDYAVWLIAVELTCHTLFGKPYTTLTDADWRTHYDAGHSPADAIHLTTRAAHAARHEGSANATS